MDKHITMKHLILILLLPIFSFGQERMLGVKTDSGYIYQWDMGSVIKSTFSDDMNSTLELDSFYTMNDSSIQVSFFDGVDIFSNIVKIIVINDTIYTNERALGCLNSCYAELGCTKCRKKDNCDCECKYPIGSCSDKNLAIFQNTSLSVWVNKRITNNVNPE